MIGFFFIYLNDAETASKTFCGLFVSERSSEFVSKEIASKQNFYLTTVFKEKEVC